MRLSWRQEFLTTKGIAQGGILWERPLAMLRRGCGEATDAAGTGILSFECQNLAFQILPERFQRSGEI